MYKDSFENLNIRGNFWTIFDAFGTKDDEQTSLLPLGGESNEYAEARREITAKFRDNYISKKKKIIFQAFYRILIF